MRAPISFLGGPLPKGYDTHGLGVTRGVWIIFLEMAISILDQPIGVILHTLRQLCLFGLICLKLVEVLIRRDIIVVEVMLHVLLLEEIARVGCRCLGFGQLHSDEAAFDVGVQNALHVAVFNLGERYILVVELVVVLH